MIKRIFLILVCLGLLTSATLLAKESVSSIDTNAIFKKKKVLKTMENVANWQLSKWKEINIKHGITNWVNATGYAGLADLAVVSKDKTYAKFLVKIGDSVDWKTGSHKGFADDYCIGQTYSILYSRYKEPKMIEKWRRQADSILAQPHTESLEWKNGIQLREWAWCDALFMGPPALAYLSTATGDVKYINMASQLWWKTTAYLYNSDEQLYFRDSSFFPKTEKNGKKVFWSRGNGWVMGGLVRMLENLPINHPDRPKFEKLYKEMVTKLISLQQADGSWHASLLDPDTYNVKETSGTGFYCYAILWGMNNGLLDKKANWPVAKKAWTALATSVQADGMLGYVQAIGAAPGAVTDKSTEVYGMGAFLLAGNQLMKLMDTDKKLVK